MGGTAVDLGKLTVIKTLSPDLRSAPPWAGEIRALGADDLHRSGSCHVDGWPACSVRGGRLGPQLADPARDDGRPR